MNLTSVLITREEAWPDDAPVRFTFGESLVETCCPNVFRRYELAAKAKFDVVYVQDDDMVVDVKRLWQLHCVQPKGLTANMPFGFQQIYQGTGVTMVGFGSFFPRWMAERFVEHQQFWRDEFGDEIFDTEADRFFTFSHRPFRDVTVALRQNNRPVKMSNRPNHYAIRAEIFQRLKGLGTHP